MDDQELIKKIIDYVKPYFEGHNDVGNLFEIDSIKLELNIPDDEIRNEIENTKSISTEERDRITDVPDNSVYYNPLQIKTTAKFNEEMSFAFAVELLGDLLKSSEELQADIKQDAYILFAQSCIILWKKFRESLLSFAKKINDDIIVKKKAEEGCNFEDIRNSLNKSYEDFCDIIKVSVPLAISGFIFDCVGTEKLKRVFIDYYESCSYDSPEKLLSLMLLSDLKVPDWAKFINEYIKHVQKKDFLWIVFFKCQYYYQFNYFGASTKKIINPMADCYIKINNGNKQSKSKLIDKFESLKIRDDN